MSTAEAAHFRRRAIHLRELAITIERASVMRLDRDAGDDTWRGRRVMLCRNLLHTNQRQLHAEAEALRWQAYLFEREADRLDAQAMLHPGRAG